MYVWDAFKAYIGGVLIQQTATFKKLDREKTHKYEDVVKRLEKEYQNNTPPT